jgi:protein-S-isoprenylcysteine O-methyltransferase Ste14
MKKRMSVMGIGHKAGSLVGGCLVLTATLSYVFSPLFRITGSSYGVLLTVGIILAASGFSLNLAAAFQMLRAYKKDRLATKGLYHVFLHPMYFFMLFVTLPGITLLFNSWLVLTAVPVGIAAVKYFVKEENSQRREHDGIYKEDERLKEIETSGLFTLVEKIEYLLETRNNGDQFLKTMKSVPAFASILDGLDDMSVNNMNNEIKEVINEYGKQHEQIK